MRGFACPFGVVGVLAFLLQTMGWSYASSKYNFGFVERCCESDIVGHIFTTFFLHMT